MEALGAIAPIFSLVGGAVSAFGSMEQASATSAAMNYQAQVATYNAQLQRQNAAWATQEGEANATSEGLKTRAIVGAEKATQAASNISVDSGSAVDVRSSADELGELNVLTIRSNAARKAYGFNVDATADLGQAALDRQEASQAQSAGITGALGSLLGGASSAGRLYSQWQTYNPTGGGGGGGGIGSVYSPISGGSSVGNYGGIM